MFYITNMSRLGRFGKYIHLDLQEMELVFTQIIKLLSGGTQLFYIHKLIF